MALTTTQTAKLFKILQVPQNGGADVIGDLISIFGPATESFDFAGAVSLINTRITALSTDQSTEIATLITQWDTDSLDFNELKVDSQGRQRGVLVDYDRRKRLIRDTIQNILGVSLPRGGLTGTTQFSGKIIR